MDRDRSVHTSRRRLGGRLPLALALCATLGLGTGADAPDGAGEPEAEKDDWIETAVPRGLDPPELTPDNLREWIERSWDHPDPFYKRHVRSAIAREYPETAEGLFSRAYLTPDPFEEAALLERAIEIDPTFVEAWWNLERTYWYDLHDRTRAGEVWERASISGSDPGMLRWVEAKVASRSPRLEEAIGLHREAVQMIPDRPKAYADLCDALVRDKRLTEGERVLREGLAALPDDPRLLAALGWLYQDEFFRFDEAERYLTAALEHSDRGPFYLRAMGDFFSYQREDPHRAIAFYREAYLTSGEPWMLVQMARVYKETLRDADTALSLLRRAADGAPQDNGTAFVRMAEILERGDEAERASVDSVLREGVAKAPWDAELAKYLVEHLRDTGKEKEACDLVERTVERFSWDRGTHYQHARCIAEKQPRKAQRIWREYLQRHPDHSAALDNYSWCLGSGLLNREDPLSPAEGRRRAEALAVIEDGLRLVPDDHYLNARLHALFSSSQEENEPIEVYERLWSETGDETFLLQAAEYLETTPAGHLGAGLYLEEAYQNELTRSGRQLYETLWMAGIYLKISEQIDDLGEVIHRTSRIVTEHRPEYFSAQWQHLDMLGKSDWSAFEERADDLLRTYPDNHDLHRLLMNAWAPRDLTRATEHAHHLRWDEREWFVPQWLFRAGEWDAFLAFEDEARARPGLARGDKGIHRWAIEATLRRLEDGGTGSDETDVRIVAPQIDGVGRVSPDGRWAANLADGLIWIRNLDHETLEIAIPTEADRLMEFSPDSSMILVGSHHFWEAYDVREGTLVGVVPRVTATRRFKLPLSLVTARWSADSTQIAQQNRDTFFVHDLRSGRMVRQVAKLGLSGDANPGAFDWSPDGRWFAVANIAPTSHSIVIHDALTGEVLRTITPRHPAVRALALNDWGVLVRFDPTGRHLAFGLGGKCNCAEGLADPKQGHLFLLDLHHGQVRKVQPLMGVESDDDVAFSADGRLLAVCRTISGDKVEVSVWEIDDLAKIGTIESDIETYVSLNPEGTALYYDGRYEIGPGLALSHSYRESLVELSYPQIVGQQLEFIDENASSSATWDLQRGSLLAGRSLPVNMAKNALDWPEFVVTRHGSSLVYRPAGRDTLVEVDPLSGRAIRELAFLEGWEPWSIAGRADSSHVVVLYARSVDPAEQAAFISSLSNLEIAADVLDMVTGERVVTVARPLITSTELLEEKRKLSYRRTRPKLWLLAGGEFFALHIQVSMDGRPSVSAGELEIYRSSDGKQIDSLSVGEVSSLRESVDGTRLAIGTEDGKVVLLDTQNMSDPTYLRMLNLDASQAVSAIHPWEGDWLVAMGQRVERWDLEKGRMIGVVAEDLRDVRWIGSVDDRRWIFASSTEISVYDAVRGNRLATLLGFDNGDWVSYTPEGYYHSSITGDQELYWADGEKLTPFAALAPALRESGAVYEKLTHGEIRSVPVSPSLLSQSEAIELPRVLVLEPNPHTVVDGRDVQLVLRLEQGSEPIQKVLVRRGNQTTLEEIDLSTSDAYRNDARGFAERSVHLSLGPGDLVLHVNAVTEHLIGPSVALPITVRDPGGDAASPKGQLHYVGIGVSRHERSAYDLTYADEDAEALGELLATRSVGLYDAVNVDVLTNEDADRTSVIDLLSDAARQRCSEDDTLVIFIAGHGLHDGNDLFFLAHDSDAQALDATAVWWQQVDLQLERSRCGRTLLLLDTCHAGGFYEGAFRGAQVADLGIASQDPFATEIARGSGIKVLAASEGAGRSYEDAKWQHGAFTYALLEALGGAGDVDRDGRVSVEEAEVYVKQRVGEITDRKQTPTSPKVEGFGDYALAHVPAPVPAGG